MSNIPGKVIVTMYHTNMGQTRMRVKYNGAQKSLPYDHSSSDPFLTAMLYILGRGVKINDQERNHGANRIVFYIDPRTVGRQ